MLGRAPTALAPVVAASRPLGAPERARTAEFPGTARSPGNSFVQVMVSWSSSNVVAPKAGSDRREIRGFALSRAKSGVSRRSPVVSVASGWNR